MKTAMKNGLGIVGIVAALLGPVPGCSSGGAGQKGADLAAGAGEGDLATGASDASTDGPGTDPTGTDLSALPDQQGTDLRAPPPDLSAPGDLRTGPSVLTVRITASNTCKISTDPPSYAVTAGSTFTVNWVNSGTSSYEVDVAKRDAFNLVPIVLGLEPGNSYHDTIRQWCGAFTGTFWFRISTACDTYEIPVSCNK